MWFGAKRDLYNSFNITELDDKFIERCDNVLKNYQDARINLSAFEQQMVREERAHFVSFGKFTYN